MILLRVWLPYRGLYLCFFGKFEFGMMIKYITVIPIRLIMLTLVLKHLFKGWLCVLIWICVKLIFLLQVTGKIWWKLFKILFFHPFNEYEKWLVKKKDILLKEELWRLLEIVPTHWVSSHYLSWITNSFPDDKNRPVLNTVRIFNSSELFDNNWNYFLLTISI